MCHFDEIPLRRQRIASVQFTVFGKPEPKGSIKSFLTRPKDPAKKPRVVLTNDNRAAGPWMQQIAGSAIAAMSEAGFDCWDRAAVVGVRLTFWLARPPSVPRRRGFPIVKPDVDKLARAAMDALTGTVFADDAQVADLVVAKRYGTPERVEIQIARLPDTAAVTAPAEEFPLFAGPGLGIPKTPTLVGS